MPDAIDALIDEVTVDAYGDAEQLEAFRQAFEDSGALPFAGHVVGVDVEVVAIDFDGSLLRGLVAHCQQAGRQDKVALLDVTPAADLSPGLVLLINAHRLWAGVEPQPHRRR
jgi:hypothetical protein